MADEAVFITDSRYYEAACNNITGAEVRLSTNKDPCSAQIKAVLDGQGINAIGFEEYSVTYAWYLEWNGKLEKELVPAQKLITGLRAVKTPGDLDQMKKAQRIAEKSFEEILPMLNADITEKEFAAELTYRMLKNGADDKAFDPIVVSGPRSSMPHGVPGPEKIAEGFITVDFGARLNGWCSDTTRTLCKGRPTAEMAGVYETVLTAQKAGINAVRAGVEAKEVDAAARTVITEAGYGEYFGHGFGHELGLEVHETLKVSPVSGDILPAGAVISAEPGIYIPGKYGVRIEDVLYVTETGSENITNLSKNLIVL